jgi:outer membrane protein assembly factor BamB
MAPAASGGVAFEPLWQAKIHNDRYYASPLLHGGLIYAITQASVLSVLDAETGARVYEQTADLGKGTVYPSPAAPGDLVFLSSDTGTTLVLRPGRAYEVLAKNSLEPFRASPVFEGKRMYIRGLKSLWCIGE